MLVYSSGAGFLLGYLWTRLSFGLAIKEADIGLVARRIEKFEAEIRADHHSLLLVTRQLSQTHGEPRVPQEELNAAVIKATRHTKVRVFYDAVAARQDPGRLDQSISVFRALIASDTGETFHRPHAELGYALKDQAQPDWEAAEQALTRAIEIRNRVRDTGYGSYEFNRAVCRIHLKRSRELILTDFTKAAGDEWVRSWTLDDQTLEWFKQNDLIGWWPPTGVGSANA
jgi:hypothetical protein